MGTNLKFPLCRGHIVVQYAALIMLSRQFKSAPWHQYIRLQFSLVERLICQYRLSKTKECEFKSHYWHQGSGGREFKSRQSDHIVCRCSPIGRGTCLRSMSVRVRIPSSVPRIRASGNGLEILPANTQQFWGKPEMPSNTGTAPYKKFDFHKKIYYNIYRK